MSASRRTPSVARADDRSLRPAPSPSRVVVSQRPPPSEGGGDELGALLGVGPARLLRTVSSLMLRVVPQPHDDLCPGRGGFEPVSWMGTPETKW